MKPFHESLRYDYPLTANSLVIDIGAHTGRFAAEISRRYGCRVLAFEPISQFHDACAKAVASHPNVTLHNFGLGPVSSNAIFGVKGDMTGSFTASDQSETVRIESIDLFMPLSGCDLIKINIEGGEYDLLEHMIRTRLHLGCKNIQVQFHGNVPSCMERWRSIRTQLLASHHLTYDAPFCWENYRLGPCPTPFSSHFDHAFVINRDCRTDRWAIAQRYLKQIGVNAERFSAIDNIIYEGSINGNAGCTASHRAIMERIAQSSWSRVLVLEDDFLPLHANIASLMDAAMHQVPADMDLLYLGGHYAEPPIARASHSVVRCGRMLTTSSYIVARDHAARMAPTFTGIGPIDNLFSGFSGSHNHYILQPRLFAQWTSRSDLCNETRNNVICMTDVSHENLV